jgi:hypothetical protein
MPEPISFEVDGVVFEIRSRPSDDGQGIEFRAFRDGQPASSVSSVTMEIVGDMAKLTGDSAEQALLQTLKCRLDCDYGLYEVVKENNRNSSASVVDTIRGEINAIRRADVLNNDLSFDERLSGYFYSTRRSQPQAR